MDLLRPDLFVLSFLHFTFIDFYKCVLATVVVELTEMRSVDKSGGIKGADVWRRQVILDRDNVLPALDATECIHSVAFGPLFTTVDILWFKQQE